MLPYDGKTYAKCRVSGVTESGVNIDSANGRFLIPLDKVPFSISGRFKTEITAARAKAAGAVQQAADTAAFNAKYPGNKTFGVEVIDVLPNGVTAMDLDTDFGHLVFLEGLAAPTATARLQICARPAASVTTGGPTTGKQTLEHWVVIRVNGPYSRPLRTTDLPPVSSMRRIGGG